MYSVILAIIISVIVGSCLYGKDFWEKRFNVLLMSFVAAFVSMLGTSLVFRNDLPLVSGNWQNKQVVEFYVDSIKISDSNNLFLKENSINMYKAKVEDFSKRVITDTVKNTDGTFTVKYTPTKQIRTHLVVRKDLDGDTSVWFVTKKNGDFKLDYFTVGNDFYVMPSQYKTEDSLVIKYYSINHSGKSKWVIPEIIPVFKSYYCLYVPQNEYDVLPESVKIRTKFPGAEKYTASL